MFKPRMIPQHFGLTLSLWAKETAKQSNLVQCTPNFQRLQLCEFTWPFQDSINCKCFHHSNISRRITWLRVKLTQPCNVASYIEFCQTHCIEPRTSVLVLALNVYALRTLCASALAWLRIVLQRHLFAIRNCNIEDILRRDI